MESSTVKGSRVKGRTAKASAVKSRTANADTVKGSAVKASIAKPAPPGGSITHILGAVTVITLKMTMTDPTTPLDK